MPELTVKLGDKTLQTCRFDGELLRIGRSRENDVVLENLSVSRLHVQIRLHEGHFILTDMNSANGTLVNGVRVTKTEIVDEDVITIGKHKLLFSNLALPEPVAGDDPSTVQRTVMVEPRAEAWLEVDTGRLKGREFKITRFETSLGKAPSNDVVLTDDWLLGKKQAIILRKGNHGFEIQDFGGLRRVKVNGAAVSERAELKDGDRIELGGTALIFHASDLPQKATGRVPSEITAETPEPHEARVAAFSRPMFPSTNGAHRPNHSLENESLDFEDGYESVKISLKDESQGAAPAAEDTDNAVTGTNPVPDLAVSANGVAGANGHVKSSASGNGQRNVFEDTRSSGRRKKHHKRAAQKQEDTNPNAEPAQTNQSVGTEGSEKKQKRASQTVPDDKEIQIWEEALKNASPAIRRQAARTLKKLTGRDYEV